MASISNDIRFSVKTKNNTNEVMDCKTVISWTTSPLRRETPSLQPPLMY